MASTQESRAGATLDDFADALRSEFVAGAEILGGWTQHVHSRGEGRKLFELESWLRGLRAFFEPANLPLHPSDRERIVERDFSRELEAACDVFLISETLAAAVARVGQPDQIEFGSFLEAAMQRERNLDHHHERVLEQASPLDSLSRLIEMLGDLRNLAEGAGSCRLERFLAVGRTYRKLVGECRYVDILLSQRFRPLTDRIDSVPLANAIRAVREPVLRRAVTLILIHAFRLLNYVEIIRMRLAEDRPLSPTVVLLCLLSEEAQTLSASLRSATLQSRLSSPRLRSTVDLSLRSLREVRQRVLERELAGGLTTDIPGLCERVENASGLLANCFQTTVVGIAQALDRSIEVRAVFPFLEERQAVAQRLQQDLWNLLVSVRAVSEQRGEQGLDLLLEKINGFRATSMRDLMYRDWANFERFSDALVVVRDSAELQLQLGAFIAYLDGLVAAVSRRSVLRSTYVEGVGESISDDSEEGPPIC